MSWRKILTLLYPGIRAFLDGLRKGLRTLSSSRHIFFPPSSWRGERRVFHAFTLTSRTSLARVSRCMEKHCSEDGERSRKSGKEKTLAQFSMPWRDPLDYRFAAPTVLARGNGAVDFQNLPLRATASLIPYWNPKSARVEKQVLERIWSWGGKGGGWIGAR